MLDRLIWNDIQNNKLLSAATVFFMSISAMMLALSVLLFANLLGSIDTLMDRAQVPDLLQMHTGAIDESMIRQFAQEQSDIDEWQIARFLNLENSEVLLDGHSLIDSTQDNGLSPQSEHFDYLLDLENERPDVLPGQVYVPVCYRERYDLKIGDPMEIGEEKLMIAGFLRDAQMNSMMASSKRFLVNEQDYERLRSKGVEEYLIEFLVKEGADTSAVSRAYMDRGLPSNGPAISKPLIGMMNALSDGTTIFVLFLAALVVLLVALLCIRFILSIRMERDLREVGMLKAIGIDKQAIRRLYFSKYLLFSVCGGLLGLGLATLFKGPLEQQIKALYGASRHPVLAMVAALFAVLIVETMILLRIRRSLKKTDRISVRAALFAHREQKPNRSRYVLIGIVTAACTFLMLLPQNLYATVSSPTFVTYMGIGNADLRMDIRQGTEIERVTKQLASTLDQDSQVLKYTVLQTRSLPALLADDSTTPLIVEFGDHSIFPVDYSKGHMPLANDEIALSSLNAKESGLSIGDPLWLQIDGEKKAYTVCGIYSDITNGGKTAKASAQVIDAPVIWSVGYVSLKDRSKILQWMKTYDSMGVDVTDIAHYVQETYGPTLRQLGSVSFGAVLIAVSIVLVVVSLFLRLIVERNRDAISLQKCLGFTSGEIRKTYCLKGFLSALTGLVLGSILGTMFGESLCRAILRSFGADSFHFIIRWEFLLLWIPAVILGTTILAIWMGTSEVKRIKAYECFRGKE